MEKNIEGTSSFTSWKHVLGTLLTVVAPRDSSCAAVDLPHLSNSDEMFVKYLKNVVKINKTRGLQLLL